MTVLSPLLPPPAQEGSVTGARDCCLGWLCVVSRISVVPVEQEWLIPLRKSISFFKAYWAQCGCRAQVYWWIDTPATMINQPPTHIGTKKAKKSKSITLILRANNRTKHGLNKFCFVKCSGVVFSCCLAVKTAKNR